MLACAAASMLHCYLTPPLTLCMRLTGQHSCACQADLDGYREAVRIAVPEKPQSRQLRPPGKGRLPARKCDLWIPEATFKTSRLPLKQNQMPEDEAHQPAAESTIPEEVQRHHIASQMPGISVAEACCHKGVPAARSDVLEACHEVAGHEGRVQLPINPCHNICAHKQPQSSLTVESAWASPAVSICTSLQGKCNIRLNPARPPHEECVWYKTAAKQEWLTRAGNRFPKSQ